MRIPVLSRVASGLMLSVFLAGPALAAPRRAVALGPDTRLGATMRVGRHKPMSPLVRIPKRLPTLIATEAPRSIEPAAPTATVPAAPEPAHEGYRSFSTSERGPIDEKLKQAYALAQISWTKYGHESAFVIQSPKRYMPPEVEEKALHWTDAMLEQPENVPAELLAKPLHFVPRTSYMTAHLGQQIPRVAQVLGKKILIVESNYNSQVYKSDDDPNARLFHIKLPLPSYPIVIASQQDDGRTTKVPGEDTPGAIKVKLSMGKDPDFTKVFVPEHLEDTSHLEGMDALRLALAQEQTASLPSAAEYGSVPGKGYLLVGPPGTGKSKSAMMVAEKLGRPLYTLRGSDFGSMYEGQSEGNMAAILKGFEGKKAVIHMDEIEKMFPSDSKRPHTNGVQESVLAELLPFMARNQDIFFVFTANTMQLPAELVRSGRISRLFYVGLPERDTRASILETTLATRGWKPAAHDLSRLADVTAGYSGAELEEVVNDAIRIAGHRSQNTSPPTGQDLLDAVHDHPPLSLTKKAEYDAMRNWARDVNAKDAAGRRSDSILPKGGIVTVEAVSKDASHLGGFARFKSWMEERAGLARMKDGSTAKGALLVGVPGTGKTIAAQVAAHMLKRPLLRLSFGAFLDRDPAGAVRQVIREIRDAGPVVLLLDELEKMLEIRELPSMGPVMAELLEFLNTQQSAFVVATANDVSSVPPEFMRRGRFDRTFVVDLPTHNERKSVFRALIDQRPRNKIEVYGRDLEGLAAASRSFSPAEIDGAIKDAIDSARVQRRVASAKDILSKLSETTPKAVQMAAEFTELRKSIRRMGSPVSDEAPEEIVEPTRRGMGFIR